MIALGIVIFAVGILLSVALHEVGHLVPAKRFGVHVPQYMVGFGPTLFSRKRGETEYGLKALPLGGYVRLSGMYPPNRGGRRGRLFDKLIEDARNQALGEIPPGDEHRAFYRLTPGRKLVVMAGGPAMNLLLGLVFLVLAYSAIGQVTATSEPTLASVSACLPVAGATTAGCAPGAAPGPARAAGIVAGDRVEAVAGTTVTSWDQASTLIAGASGPTPFVVSRDGVRRTVTVDVARVQRPDPADATRTITRGFVGIGASTNWSYHHAGPGGVLRAYGQQVGGTAKVLLHFPQRLVAIAQLTFSGKPRDASSPVGIVGASRFGGEIAAEQSVPPRARVGTFLGILASVNIALAVFNLVPLLPLDGGHILGALWEAVRRRVARARNRPDPGFVDVARALPIAYAVTLLVVASSALLLYADVVNPVRLFG